MGERQRCRSSFGTRSAPTKRSWVIKVAPPAGTLPVAKGEVWKNMQAYSGSRDLCRDRQQLNTYIDTVFDDISNGVKNDQPPRAHLVKKAPARSRR